MTQTYFSSTKVTITQCHRHTLAGHLRQKVALQSSFNGSKCTMSQTHCQVNSELTHTHTTLRSTAKSRHYSTVTIIHRLKPSGHLSTVRSSARSHSPSFYRNNYTRTRTFSQAICKVTYSHTKCDLTGVIPDITSGMYVVKLTFVKFTYTEHRGGKKARPAQTERLR